MKRPRPQTSGAATIGHGSTAEKGGRPKLDGEMNNLYLLAELSFGAGLDLETADNTKPGIRDNMALEAEHALWEEERWRTKFPEIKECAIVLDRQRVHDVMEVKEREAGLGDSKPPCGRTEKCCAGRPCGSGNCNYRICKRMRFVRTMEFKVQGCLAAGAANCRWPAGSGLVQLRRCFNSDVLGDDHAYRSNEKREDAGYSSDSECSYFKAEDTPTSFQSRKLRLSSDQKNKLKFHEEKKNSTDTALKKVKDEQVTHQRRRRRASCKHCVACLREDCGKCIHCLDKKKFGGPQKRKQRCLYRVCLVKGRRKTVPDSADAEEELSINSRKLQQDQEEEERGEVDSNIRKLRKHQRRRRRGEEEVKKEVEEPRRWRIEEEMTMTMEESEELEIKAVVVRGDEEQEEEKEEMPAQDDFAHRVPTGLLVITPVPSPPLHLHPLLLVPQEEDGEMEVMLREEQLQEEEPEEDQEVREGVSDLGRFFEVQVELLDSDEMVASPSSEADEDDYFTPDTTCERPESISLTCESLSLFGGVAGCDDDDEEGGRGLLKLLLQEMRSAVLPAHWVAVLADGPVLQLLQCSKLSSMSDTVVQVQPDLCFDIIVQRRALPHTHAVFRKYLQRITCSSQLVSLLFDLEQLHVCRGSDAGPKGRWRRCHLLVAPPLDTCVPCLREDEDEDEGSGDDL